MTIAAVVLAAGASKRLGRPKQTLVLDGQTLVERAARVAMRAGLSPVIVVVRPMAEFTSALRKIGCVVVPNDQADEGMAASIRAGVLEAMGTNGLVIMTCDQIAVSVEHLRALYVESERMTGSLYAGRIGIPAYFPATRYAELMELHGDSGARTMLHGVTTVQDEALALDVDTEADWDRALAFLATQRR
jgi:molybdenum cofactor cytidylyltransferase